LAICCPVPRTVGLSGSGALFISARYVLTTIAACTGCFVFLRRITAAGNMGYRLTVLQLCGAVAWGAPVLLFFVEHSPWAIPLSAVLAGSASKLAYLYHRAYVDESVCQETTSETTSIFTLADSASGNSFPMLASALSLHVAFVCAVSGWPRM